MKRAQASLEGCRWTSKRGETWIFLAWYLNYCLSSLQEQAWSTHLMDLPCRCSTRIMGANHQASDYVRINGMPSTQKETSAPETGEPVGGRITLLTRVRIRRDLFPFSPLRSLHSLLCSALLWVGPAAPVYPAFPWVRFKLTKFHSFP